MARSHDQIVHKLSVKNIKMHIVAIEAKRSKGYPNVIILKNEMN